MSEPLRMDLYDVVTKLTGPIRPAGDSTVDPKRRVNLERTIELVDRLLDDIEAVANLRGSYEWSVSQAAGDAVKYLDLVKERFE